ncbi:MAG: hypothetical protein L6435_12215 [Anaerolineae bacterium]|nr:hypothetical protein [Anaerolineae bacterium]
MTSSGILGQLRQKRWHVSKGELSRMQKKKGIRRARQKQRKRDQRSTR